MKLLRSNKLSVIYTQISKNVFLSDCYAKPSLVKQAIFDSWCDWVKEVNHNGDNYILMHLTIESYNCMMFTLSIDVYNLTGQLVGKIYITKTRQEFWTI